MNAWTERPDDDGVTATALRAEITPDDRLALTVFIAIVLHAMVVLGISFAPDPGGDPRFEALEIILVPERSPQAPEEADLLAQANLEGGGDADESARPASPVKAPLPAPTATIAAAPPPPQDPLPLPAAREAPAAHTAAAAPVEEKLAEEAPRAALAQPARREPSAATQPAPAPADVPEPAQQVEVRAEPLPTAAQLLTRSFALASLNAELQQRLDSRAKRPRQKYISASTREYRYAAYMEAWRAKVERIGNINYPDEARARQLSGSLLLDVALTPDGQVQEITVRQSSGHQVLDDAAVRIVELAAPFAPFPEDIRREVDVLHVTRTWRFLNNEQFSAQ
jgi:protein TonB